MPSSLFLEELFGDRRALYGQGLSSVEWLGWFWLREGSGWAGRFLHPVKHGTPGMGPEPETGVKAQFFWVGRSPVIV
ncbi:protein of unknown function [Kyrpidia spormannii]|uniref:Uncharacterized protein n=2 Tax=Kyrpidia spormannii TaxID=2055160 RepID=A0ACA8Z7Y5_9BACL|nr:protein of unknown function [Kyrpidia spormannii]CAB3392415.1 protein of unknown function [Kyrpidia spormannii]